MCIVIRLRLFDLGCCCLAAVFLAFPSVAYGVRPPEPQSKAQDRTTAGRNPASSFSKSRVSTVSPRDPRADVADGGVCRFDEDCDDCNTCTVDRCDNGTCYDTPRRTCDSCGDGIFCNGAEICDDFGVCAPGRSDVCSWPPGTICDAQGGAWGQGACVAPCRSNADCNDGRDCTGVDACVPQECVNGLNEGEPCETDADCNGSGVGYCGGVCRSIDLPCLFADACREDFCAAIGVGGGSIGDPCVVDVDCGNPGGYCQREATCVVNGRCCTNDGNGDFLQCSRENKTDCDSLGGRWLFVGDDPYVLGDQANCSDPAYAGAPRPGELFSCPLYSSGIAPSGTYLGAVGPIGEAPCVAIHELGDDYELAGVDPASEYLVVYTIRYIGGFDRVGIQRDPSYLRVRFYNESGQLIAVRDARSQGDAPDDLRTIVFDEPPVIPVRGWITLSSSPRFSPFGRHYWKRTDAVDTGANDETQVWLNGGPVPSASVLPSGEPGILAFEIVGYAVPEPLGACCGTNGAVCDRQLPWDCQLAGGVFRGIGTHCRPCSNDPYGACSTDSDCPTCVGGPDGEPCDPHSDCPGGECVANQCVGGNNDLNPCKPDVDCPGGTCTGMAACNPGPTACLTTACCDAASGDCTEVTGAVCSDTAESCLSDVDCPGADAVCEPPCPVGLTSRGFGTTCEPNLCTQPVLTGYDTCVEAALPQNLIQLDVATLSGCETESVTVTGDNLDATFVDPIDSCVFEPFSPIGAAKDRGWWHAFNINACANVRVDFCGTLERSGEAKDQGWNKLWGGCDPCGATVSASVVGDAGVGGCVGDAEESGGLGRPFCAGEDSWFTFGPIPPGTYWYPVYSAPGGTFGAYQLHIAASACPAAACCLPQSLCVKADESLAVDGLDEPVSCVDDASCNALLSCDNNSDRSCMIDSDCPACIGGPTPDAFCTTDADCGTGGTCTGIATCASATCSYCAVMNELACDDVDGTWNGYGSTRDQCPRGGCYWGVCVSGFHDGFPCDTDGDQPVTSCDTGVCDIGSCCYGPGDCVDRAPVGICTPIDPLGCMDRFSCEATPGAVFEGGRGCLDIPSPCSACEFIGEGNCQYPLNGGFVYMSDLSGPGGGVVAADDFVPFGGTISEICTWGAYLDPSAPGTNQGMSEEYDCAGMVTDHFRVRVFEDRDGLPGRMIGQSEVTDANIQSGYEPNTVFEVGFYGVRMFNYTLTLDTPITGLVPGQRHWIEVANDTVDPLGNTCFWHWAMHFPTDRDAYCASGLSPRESISSGMLDRASVYVNGSERGGVDLAFCLSGPDGPLDFESPPADVAACWTCGGTNTPPSCTVKTSRQCVKEVGVWDRTDPTCTELEPPEQPNDYCYRTETKSIESSAATCGDGVLDPGEQCDDGNVQEYDGCDANCLIECSGGGGPWPFPILQSLYSFNNACANVDGPTLVRGEGGDTGMDGDIWFEYTSTCTGVFFASMCATQSGRNQDGYTALDGMIAVYHDDLNYCAGGASDGQICVCPGNPPRAKCIDPTQCPGTSICDENGFPPGCSNGAIGMCRNFCPCPGPIHAAIPWEILGADESCNGIADAGSAYVETIAFPNECFMVRVGAWMPLGAAVGTGHRGPGLLEVYCSDRFSCFWSSPPEPELGLDRFGEMVPWNRPRMISFQGGDAGRSQAVRVTWKDMPTGWEAWNGQSLFVQEPWWGSEASGTSFYDPVPEGTPDSLQLAQLDCEPFFTDWSSYGVVHVIHPAIVPSKYTPAPVGPVVARYDIDIIDDSCPVIFANIFSDPIEVRTAVWADLVELDNGDYLVPGDRIDVTDTVAMVAKFTGQVGAPSKASASLMGVFVGPLPELDGKITISELVAVIEAFKGRSFPFLPADIAPPPGPCPP